MFLAILKDSSIIFLIIYAIYSLAEKLCKFLEAQLVVSPPARTGKFTVIDITLFSIDQLECILRRELSIIREPLILSSEKTEPEAEFIIKRLQRHHPELYYIPRSELTDFIFPPKERDASLKAEQGAVPVPNK